MEIVAEYLPTDHRHQLGVLDIALLLKAVESFGVKTTPILEDLGLVHLDWQSEKTQLTYADKLMLFRHVSQQFHDVGLGLLIGERAKLSHFGLLGYAILSSRTLEEAIKTGFKYLNLNGPVFSVKVTIDDGIASIVLENTLEIGELLPFCSEYFFSALVAMFEELTGERLTITRLCFPYRAPAYGSKYSERFNCAVEFEAPSLRLSFCSSLLSLPLKTHNADMLSNCLQSCDSVIAALQSPYLLTNQIKTILYQSAGVFPSIEALAMQFGCSSRTLRRKLEQDGTSYQKLLGEVRSDIAKEFLLRTELTIEEIAFRLGYSDTANFRRGFKRWTGITPQRFRGIQ
ncbi:AraC family transcriptional regulator [Vibrio europaeus]|uniref:AraC family transcriptional regulator n=1 Tax=Vibrio europaeus TaxID=300876 RepID=UPI00148D9230|nr:AraC family transcriptional regulator [Vibrio europaeus]NOH24963.1 AraC family transcriptional regulator [Vibrio europaeus]